MSNFVLTVITKVGKKKKKDLSWMVSLFLRKWLIDSELFPIYLEITKQYKWKVLVQTNGMQWPKAKTGSIVVKWSTDILPIHFNKNWLVLSGFKWGSKGLLGRMSYFPLSCLLLIVLFPVSFFSSFCSSVFCSSIVYISQNSWLWDCDVEQQIDLLSYFTTDRDKQTDGPKQWR